MRVLIVGAGGHAQVVADILLHQDDLYPIGYVDDDLRRAVEKPLGLPVLGTLAQIASIPHDAVVVAIGDNKVRQRLFEQLYSTGEHFATARHPHSTVAHNTQIGPGTMICAGVIVNSESTVGANTILNTGSTLDHHNHLGNHVHIAPGVHTGGEVVIDEGALIGIGAIVLPRRHVGAWCQIGAGSVVTADVPAHATVLGVPARLRSH
jgi:sugar O-acyltransferase (sialic acid O-acetyltransferase NeuD family)